MTPKISIAALIYRSPAFAQWCYDSVIAATPELSTGEAEFYFVANDPMPEVISYLREHRIPHYLNYNDRLTPAELFARGYAKPEYIHRVYRGWNEAILQARGAWVVLLNSDHCPAPGWLGAMKRAALEAPRIVTARLIEPEHPIRGGIFPCALPGEYGGSPEKFRRAEFLARAEGLAKAESGLTVLGGAYMPCMFRRDDALRAGLYPEGNLAGASFDEVKECGDVAFFRKLASLGVSHVTACDAIAYHMQEGEMLAP